MFVIDKEKKYVIYGVGGNGLKMQKLLNKAQYYITCFIDKRAENVKEIGEQKVFNLKTAEQVIKDKDNTVVIITIKDVFEHTKIARQLAQAGFVNCIYKPIEVLQGVMNEEMSQISKIHDQLIVELRIPDQISLKETSTEIHIELQERLLIKQDAKEIYSWMPIELLFNYHNGEPYECINMALFFPLVELYRGFMGELISNEKYNSAIENFILYSMEWMKKNQIPDTADLRESLLNSRYKAFLEMQRIVETDQDFFVRNAPKVFYEDGRFYMSSSGRNRIAFLIAKKYRFVPVKMREEDYEKWKNPSGVEKVKDYMRKWEMENLSMPVPNPMLSSLREEYTDYISLFVMNSLNIITKQLFTDSRTVEDGLSCVDLKRFYHNREKIQFRCFMQDEGCFRRIAELCGFEAENIPSCDRERELIERLDSLLFVQSQEKKASVDKQILVLDSKLLEKNEISWYEENQIFLLNRGDHEEILNEICNRGFHVDEKIFSAFWILEKTGGYVLSKNLA